jgi:phosphoenolpyruvate carboxylase
MSTKDLEQQLKTLKKEYEKVRAQYLEVSETENVTPDPELLEITYINNHVKKLKDAALLAISEKEPTSFPIIINRIRELRPENFNTQSVRNLLMKLEVDGVLTGHGNGLYTRNPVPAKKAKVGSGNKNQA